MATIPIHSSQSFIVDTPGIVQSAGNGGPWPITLVTTHNPLSDNMMSENFVNDLAKRVGRLETDVSNVRTDLSAVKTKVDHIPTRAELYGIAITGLVIAIGVLWHFVTGPLAQEVAKLISK